MEQFKLKVQYRTTTQWVDVTDHGLLVAAWQFAEHAQAFKLWEGVRWKMQKRRYTPHDKLKTLWASLVVGCDHTSAINDKLGGHETSLAHALGLPRFPDQSQVNRLLQASQAEHVQQWRQAHLTLLARHSRARAQCRWLELANGERWLVADLDQRALAVRGKQFELAKPGYFGRKRGRRGYQLTALFLGGQVGEVVDEYFDPGDTPIGVRLKELLASLQWLCQQLEIRPDQVLVRGDAQLGTPVLITQVQQAGFHFLFKGLSAQRARKLAAQAQTAFYRGPDGAEGERRWLTDLGVVEHTDQSTQNRGAQVAARTLVQARLWPPHLPKPGAHRRRVKTPQMRVEYSYYLTDLTALQLPLEAVQRVYDERATIERYFYDETYALGAQHVRTKHFAGAAFFQFLVATTNNLLRWLQHTVFAQTELERLGLGRLIQQAFQIPARLSQVGTSWLIELPAAHHLVRQLQRTWSALAAPAGP